MKPSHHLLSFSYAELPKETKNTISHRRRAIEKLREWLLENPQHFQVPPDDESGDKGVKRLRSAIEEK